MKNSAIPPAVHDLLAELDKYDHNHPIDVGDYWDLESLIAEAIKSVNSMAAQPDEEETLP